MLSAPLGGKSWSRRKREGKRFHLRVIVCVDASPRLCSSYKTKAGTAWHCSPWKESCLAPLQMPVLPLLDLLLIPLCECWVLGRAAVARGCKGRLQGAQLPWAEGLVQGCPSSPQHAQSLLPGQSSGLSTELIAYVESVNCTAISLVYMNQ